MSATPPIVRLLLGALGAGAWGVAAGALTLLASGGAPLVERGERLARALEVGAVVALVGLAAGGLAGLLPRRREGARPLAGIALAAGALTALALAVAATALPPDPAALRVSGDPLRLRLPAAGLGLGIAAAAALGLARLAPARRRGLLATAGPGLALLGLAGGALPAPAPGPAGGGARPDVLLLSVDTLRADHLGCYGYPLPTSPALDRLCADAVVFERALTPVPETIPAFTSLLTGRTPARHGVITNRDRADADLHTLAEAFSEAGYVTAAFLDGVLPGTFSNLDQGFDVVVQRGVVARSPAYSAWDLLVSIAGAGRSLLDDRLRRDASVTTAAAARWLRALPRERPAFLHVYFPFPHGPYAPPARHLAALPAAPAQGGPRFAGAVRRYDGEIRFTDAQLARVLGAWDRARGLDGAWVVFTADHGEELGRLAPETPEGFFGHSFFLYESSLHVPLVVRPPPAAGIPPRREPRPVPLTAVFATLLEAAGLPVPAGADPALPLASPQAGAPRAVTSTMRKSEHHPKVGLPVDRRSVRMGPWRLVETRLPAPRTELLHYAEGREEDVAPEARPEVVERLRGELERDPSGGSETAPGRALEPRERELLRSLGYIE